MALTGTIQGAEPGLLGFDASTVITSTVAKQFRAQGFSFCVRYVARGPQGPTDLSAAEADVILGAGLALMAVQHVRKVGWQPTGDLGEQDGKNAAQNAGVIGFPPGVNLWCDLEGVKKDTKPEDVAQYCNRWFAAVAELGYVPGLYVGDSAILDDLQLAELKFQHFWRSQSNVPNVRSRGYQLIQLYPQVQKNGIGIDIDVTQDDFKKGQVQWLVRGAKKSASAKSVPAKKTAPAKKAAAARA
ncbi:MAG TPA: DUF1906 domain-containing protein [Candidatus Angelobacter sp.]|nr:DUF1906 domain-containing protein [Candidatus Angelobacter sp.]